MAFLTRQFCSDPAEAITLFHDIWDGTKRREPAQPQRLRWQIRGLGAEPTNKQCAKCKHFALLASTVRFQMYHTIAQLVSYGFFVVSVI